VSVFLLDTDTLTLYQQGDATVHTALEAARVSKHTVGLSVITIEEQAKGWFGAFGKAKSPAQLAHLSRLLSEAVRTWG